MNSFKKAINIDLNESRLILSATNQIHKYSFIFLHGIGMNIQKFFEVFLSKDLIGLLDDFKIIIPQAPIRPVAMWQGKLDYSWYNKDDISTLEETRLRIEQIIEEEMKLLNNDSTRIFLGGFSQGCMVSIHVKNSLKYPLGGLITIGGFKSDYTEIKEDADFSNTLIIHGTEDETVKWDFAKKSLEPILKKDGVQVCLIEGMGHNLYSSELRKKVHDFIRERCKYNATL